MSRIYAIILSFGAAILALDQWTKHLALQSLVNEGVTKPFLSWFNFTLVHNYGAAFGMLRNLPESIRGVFFMILPFAVLFLLWWFYVRQFKENEVLGPLSMGLVLGGALGNFVDRVRHGYVVDFIDWFYPSKGECVPLFYHFTPFSCHWPKFNIADSAITTAMVLLVIHSIRVERAAKRQAKI